MEYFAELWKDKYLHIGSKKYAEACAREDSPVVEVDVFEDENGGYYGWQETGSDKYEMIWCNESLFNMQFAYGPEVEVKRGKGRVVRLDIKPKVVRE